MNANLSAPVRTRLTALDSARLISVLAVMYLHTPRSSGLQDSTVIGRFAVPFFTLAAVVLVFRSVERRPDISFRSYAWPRVKRLYGLFLTWSFFYFLVRVAGALFISKSQRPSISPLDLFWNGTTQHLWFLPFIVIVTLAAFGVAKWLHERPALQTRVIVAGVLAGCLTAWHVPHSIRNWSYTVEETADAITALFWGISFALLSRRLDADFFNRPVVVVAGIVLVLGCEAADWLLDRHLLLEHLAGLGLLMASLNDSQSLFVGWIAKGGALSLGIYLVHILWVEGFQDIAQKFGFPINSQRDILVFVTAAIASVAMVLLLNTSRYTRWLIA